VPPEDEEAREGLQQLLEEYAPVLEYKPSDQQSLYLDLYEPLLVLRFEDNQGGRAVTVYLYALDVGLGLDEGFQVVVL
jgi:hypothetical protein